MTDDHNTPCEDVLRNALMNQIGGLSATRKVSGSTPRISPEKSASVYELLWEEVLPKAEMGTRRRLNEQEPLKPVRS